MRKLVLIAVFLLALGAARAQSTSPLEEGRQLYFAGDYAGAAAIWRPLVEAGDPRAMYNMATLYRRGLGVPADPQEAERLLRSAADKGFAEAQHLLASRLFEATGADEAQRQEAVGYWLAAARQGHALSQYRLALLYWNGEAVARDLVRGYAWMSLAAAQGLADAETARVTMARYLSEAQRAQAESLRRHLVAEGGAPAAAPSPPQDMARPRPAPAPAAEPAAARPAPTAATPEPTVQRAPATATPEPTVQRTPATTDGAAKAPPARDLAASWRLQLAAFRRREAAEGLWRKLAADAPDLVSGLQHRVATVDLGAKGLFHRLQIGPFASRAEAIKQCHALEAAGQACIPVAPGRP